MKKRTRVSAAFVLGTTVALASCATHLTEQPNPATAANRCQIAPSLPMRVTILNGLGVVNVGISGTPVQLSVDSASSSFLYLAAAQNLHLPLGPGPRGLRGHSGNRAIFVRLATVKTLDIFGGSIHDWKVQVLGVPPVLFSGQLGEDVLRRADVDYDFGNGVMRLVVPKHCGDQPLAYWAVGKPVSMIEVEPYPPGIDWLVGWVRVNGIRLRALFATNSRSSWLSRAAARRVGVSPGSPGVEPVSSGSSSTSGPPQLWSAPISSVQIGSETILHTRLLVANDPSPYGADLILGMDFFLSHHIYVANSQHRIYMTYNGGPIFTLYRKRQLAIQMNAPPLSVDAAFPSPAGYYPVASRDRHEQGTAVVGVCVSPNGQLAQAPNIIRSTGHSRLDAAAIRYTYATSGHWVVTEPHGRRAATVCSTVRIDFSIP